MQYHSNNPTSLDYLLKPINNKPYTINKKGKVTLYTSYF
jgi:hypothetical protein